MNTKLVITAAVMLFAVLGLSAANDWIVQNHTPFSITVKYNIGVFGKDKTVTINPNDEYKYSTVVGCRGIDIHGIKALAGDNYFGGSSQASILREDLRGAKGGGMTWHVFAEQVLEAKTGPGLTVSFTPTKVRFFLVRRNKLLWPKTGGVVNTSVWFNPVTGAGVSEARTN